MKGIGTLASKSMSSLTARFIVSQLLADNERFFLSSTERAMFWNTLVMALSRHGMYQETPSQRSVVFYSFIRRSERNEQPFCHTLRFSDCTITREPLSQDSFFVRVLLRYPDDDLCCFYNVIRNVLRVVPHGSSVNEFRHWLRFFVGIPRIELPDLSGFGYSQSVGCLGASPRVFSTREEFKRFARQHRQRVLDAGTTIQLFSNDYEFWRASMIEFCLHP